MVPITICFSIFHKMEFTQCERVSARPFFPVRVSWRTTLKVFHQDFQTSRSGVKEFLIQRTTLRFIVHSKGVERERSVGRINPHSYWSVLGYGHLERILVSRSDVHVPRNLCANGLISKTQTVLDREKKKPGELSIQKIAVKPCGLNQI